MRYHMTCSACHEIHIGLTGKLNDRVRVQKQQICFATRRNKPCSEHFANFGQGIFNIFPVYKMFNDLKVSRIKRGTIQKLNKKRVFRKICVLPIIYSLFKYIFYIFCNLGFIKVIIESQRTNNFTVFWYLNVLVVQSNSVVIFKKFLRSILI